MHERHRERRRRLFVLNCGAAVLLQLHVTVGRRELRQRGIGRRLEAAVGVVHDVRDVTVDWRRELAVL